MAIVVDWKIKPRSGMCAQTQKRFEDGEVFYTVIFDDTESDGFIRRDFSEAVWKEMSGGFDPPPFSFWKSVYKAPAQVEEEKTFKQNSIEAMLHRMIEEDRPATENARYILALMLERKKILLPTETKDTDNRKLLFYEHKDTGSVYIVADPGLHLEEVGAIQEEVAELLAAEEEREKTGQDPSAEVVEPADEEGDADGGEAEENGEEPAESEEEAVPVSGEELSDGG